MAALADTARSLVGLPTSDLKIPPLVEDRVRRGREARQKGSSKRRLCWRFWRDEQFAYIDHKGVLQTLDTTLVRPLGDRDGKPGHRARTQRNLIRRIVQDKTSNATRRTPGYDIAPATGDPADVAAASFGSKVALAGYDKWGIRRARVKVVTTALVADGGFAMPYFDNTIGPFRQVTDEDGETEMVGAGEIKVLVLDGDQVSWEEGCDFEDSSWWAVDRGRPVREVHETPGFTGPKLTPDADSKEGDRKGKKLVLVTEYFERPCPTYPQGRKLTIANDRLILPPEDYPSVSPDGEVTDDPVLHRLSFTVDPGRDRDRGLVESMIDAQRTYNDCANKEIEWKNRCLNPKRQAPRGSNIRSSGDVPGSVDLYTVVQGKSPEWEKVPAIPPELARMKEDARQDMMFIAAHAEVEVGPDVSGKNNQVAVEQAQSSWAQFLTDLAAFDSAVMRHCLSLAARHYSEERLMKIRGDYGWEPLPAFTGADLRGQVDVRVLPDSLEPITRAGRQQRAEFLVKNFPGQFTAEQAMAALDGEGTEALTSGYRRHMAKAHKIIGILKQGPDVAMSLPTRWDAEAVDPESGMPGAYVPGWSPRRSDNTAIWRTVVSDFLTTDEADRLPEETQEMFNLLLDALDRIELQKAIRDASLQSQMAEQQGMANAAKPQGQIGKPMPDTASPGRPEQPQLPPPA